MRDGGRSPSPSGGFVSTLEYIQQGKLEKAVKSARKDLKRNPADTGTRFMLFQLLLRFEDFEGAEKELRHVQALDSTLEIHQTLAWLTAARVRHQLFAGGAITWAILGWKDQSPGYVQSFGQAIGAASRGKKADAANFLLAGWPQVKFRTGSIDGTKFRALRDADDFTGPFLEVLVNDEYGWIAFENVHRIAFQERRMALDSIWVPVHIETDNLSGVVAIPGLYAGTGAMSDELKQGLRTEFRTARNNPTRVYGQREFMYLPVGSSEQVFKGILEVKEIVFD